MIPAPVTSSSHKTKTAEATMATRVTMVGVQGALEREIADPRMARKDVMLTYAFGSAPEAIDQAQRDGGDETPVRCVECGRVDGPQDCEFSYTPGGPICEGCC